MTGAHVLGAGMNNTHVWAILYVWGAIVAEVVAIAHEWGGSFHE